MSQVEDKKIIRKFFSLTRNRILKSEFNKNVLILVGGTTIAQILPIALSPILTRLYTPEDFGTLAIFVAITSVLSVISCGRYELAIMLPEKDEDAINVAAVAFLFNIFVSTSFLIFISLFGSWLLNLLNAKNLGKLIYLAPLTVFLMGTFNILNYTNNRFKLYKDISKANIYKSIAGAVVQIVMGFFKTGALGLISGQFASQLVSNGKLFLNVKVHLKNIEKRKIKEMSIRYLKFPKYSLWAGLLNTASYQIINLVIGKFYGQEQLGQYYLSLRILGIPTLFIGSAISQVFFKQALDEKSRTGNIEKTFKNTLKKLTILSVPIFTLIFLISKPIFAIVFGKNWEAAGEYTMILTPMFAIRFVSSALSITTSIYQTLKVEILINLLLIIIPILLISLTLKFLVFITLYSFVLSIMYLLFMVFYYKLAKKQFFKVSK